MKANILFLLSLLYFTANAQQVTGVWNGRISGKKAELKIVQKGDSLTGTSYYYESAASYRRYSIKGYIDPQTNSLVWWDDQLIENKGANKNPQLSVADFNCPGGGVMKLEGKSGPKENKDGGKGEVLLSKVRGPSFPDEWDYVIDHFTIGGNDPYLIDSIETIAARPLPPQPLRRKEESRPTVIAPPSPGMASIPPPAEKKNIPQTIEEKYTARKKTFALEIPVEGDSIQIRFYDNAEIDGDSISLFLNDKMIFTHVRLSDKPYTITLPVKELGTVTALTMVAENLGAIPPNTSYMVAIVGNKRYDAQLASTENSSAMIRLRKKQE